MGWPPSGLATRYDMTGLEMRNLHLRSADWGKTWKKVSADAFETNMNGVFGEAEIGLPDGTILRGLWGQYLPYNREMRPTGYVQRSRDGSLTWEKPRLLLDPGKYKTYPKRIRRLRDGRLIVTGGVSVISNQKDGDVPEPFADIEPMLLVSSDQGRSWKGPIAVVPPESPGEWTEEWDAAELANGDLLGSFRRAPPGNPHGGHIRWQGVLVKSGASWVPGRLGPAPFPHSGHPELLATREGPVLYIAQSGICWSIDAGASWHSLGIAATGYYPRAVQAENGLIVVIGHIGGDDAYGAVDQSIVMDSFRLAKRK
jgi:hypothetical protein